ncbi:hypothetical protein CLOP_g17460 [Closterium sp. NIES-67]|nr:hypothetical protein CLOP_g17460 [Closterium sp. NIES-67]
MKRSDEKRGKPPKPSKKNKAKADSPSVKPSKKPKSASTTAACGAPKIPLRVDDDTWKQRASTDEERADRSGGSGGGGDDEPDAIAHAPDGGGPATGSAAAGVGAAGAAGTAGGEEELTGLVLRNEEFEDGSTGGSGSGGVRCLHEVAYPKGWKLPTSKEAARKPLPEKPAKEYPFKLDPFQEEAVRCLEANESVLVSAHTSAGKTVVAEYAIAMAMRDNQRVVYTSPIKALSNQKFREMSQEFGDVGLMTGDVTIAPNATCLVMTTEILRSMLYRGSDFVREVGWIIFDEVHYLRDKERGVVWEESIVMAPKSSRFVFLSATVPNAREFAEWVAKVHQQPCHIVYTDYRPTPLQHYIFPAGGMGLFLAVDEKGKFREASFQKAMNAVEGGEGGGGRGEEGEEGGKKGGKWGKGKRGAGGGGAGGAGGGRKGEESDIYKIVKMIMQRQYDPVIVFSFSRADCEALALQMSRMDLNEDEEKTLIDGIFRNAIDSLAEEDKKLPQVNSMLPLLRRGIGIHHSGLLPLLKEVIEILFQEGLLKCLFATETFSIGLNMPAKTVVFTNVRKWDGTKSRWLSGGEYIQMSGRAGRRGLDDRGICILMVDARMEPAVAKGMVKGSADPLVSAFHLSYNFILNQLRSPEVEIEETIRSSYRQFQSDRALPALQARLQALESEYSSVDIPDESSLLSLLSLRRQLSSLRAEIRSFLTSPKHALPFLSPGRVVRILCKGEGGGVGGGMGGGEGEGEGEGEEGGGIGNEEDVTVWGVVVNFKKVNRKKGGMGGGGEQQEGAEEGAADVAYDVDILTRCVEESAGRMGPPGSGKRVVRPCRPGEEGGSPLVASFPLTQLDGISAVRLFLPKDLKHKEPREAALKSLQQLLLRAGPDGVQMLDPEEDMEVNSSAYRKAVRRAEALEAMVSSHALASAPDLQARIRELARKSKLKNALKVLKKEVKAAGGLILKDELKARMRVLRRLEYIDEDEIVRVKGRVACEISSADELVVTELLFSASLAELTPETVAALLSCCVWQEKGAGGAKRPRESLQGPLAQLREIARRIARVQEECKISLDVETYVASFRPDIMEAVFGWCHGANFADVLAAADTFEGSLIRAMRRLEELLQEIIVASKTIGETNLAEKVAAASEKLKRGIVFAASLYL